MFSSLLQITNTQTKFASDVHDGVLGPPRLEGQNTRQRPCSSVNPEPIQLRDGDEMRTEQKSFNFYSRKFGTFP